MSRRKPTRTIIRAIAVCGLFMATQRHGVAQTDQQYSVASRRLSEHQQRLGCHRCGRPRRQVPVHLFLESE